MKFFEKKQKYEGPAKFYCKKCGEYRGKKRQYACNIDNPVLDEEGYLIVNKGYCKNCKGTLDIKSVIDFKKIKWNSLPVFSIFTAVVLVIITAIVLITIGGTAKVKAEKQYEKLLAEYQEMGPKTAMKSGSILLKESFSRGMNALDDYVMYVYAEDENSKIQKITENGKTTYYFDLHGVEFGEYSNRCYIWSEDEVYEFGEGGNIRYYKNSYEYALTISKIKQFLPQNFCLEGKAKAEIYLKDEAENEIYIFEYTEHKHALDYPGGFFEKYGDRLTQVIDGKENPIITIPKNVEWEEYK